LPSLRTMANDDPDADVRAAAKDAAIAVAKVNNLPDGLSSGPPAAAASRNSGRPGFGNQPRVVTSPNVYVTINSSADDSPGLTDKQARQVHADIIRASLADQCSHAPRVTTIASE